MVCDVHERSNNHVESSSSGGSANLQALQKQGRETQRFLRSDKLASDKLANPHQPPAGEALP